MGEVKDKALIVTGAASGIGAAAVKRLVTEGARVVAADINSEGLTRYVDTLASNSVRAISFDLADEQSIVNLVAEAAEWLGKIEGLVNVAADLSAKTMGGDMPVGALSKAIWNRVLDVNLIGAGLAIREALPHIVSAGGGSIVNISSVAAWLGGERPAYASSKIALHSLTRHTARQGGSKNVRCNAIAPGMVLTEVGLKTTPKEDRDRILEGMCLTRLGSPEDIASAISFLLSDRSSWITGQVISVDGGWMLRE
jgi:NAD(P)-dependent dehydrogenase (short-subunit alcohol dehydrogenase family)